MKRRLRLFFESNRFAVQALSTNRTRSLLTLLTIGVGIFLIIMVLTLVSSMESSIREGMSSLGEDMIYVMKRPWTPDENGEYKWWEYEKRPDITFKDYEDLKSRRSLPGEVAFAASTSGTAEYFDGVYNTSIENANITLASYDYYKVQPVTIDEGRYFTQMEARSGSNVAVIGAEVSAALFGNSDPLGKSFKLKGVKVQVIGVLKAEGVSAFGPSKDNLVLLPVSFGRTFINLDRLENVLLITPEEGVELGWVSSVVRGEMRTIRRVRPSEPDNFAVNESNMISNGLDEVFASMNIVGFFVGGFAMLVGGFSIANIMLVSVKERTPLIGIQKALGAKRAFILNQFLTESILLSLIGGTIGLLLVALVSWLISFSGFDVVLTLGNVAIGVLISSLTGLVFGILPALRASRLNPVDAIRS